MDWNRRLMGFLVPLWLLSSAGLYFAERGVEGANITSFGEALYWGIAAFSTAGLAETPVSSLGQTIGGIWIIVGSVLFFGTIIATVTTYFMRPLETPARQIVEAIQDNLERLDELSVEDLDLLKETIDSLVEHVEHLKEADGVRKKT